MALQCSWNRPNKAGQIARLNVPGASCRKAWHRAEDARARRENQNFNTTPALAANHSEGTPCGFELGFFDASVLEMEFVLT
jgi:hypothetical protein